MRLFDDWMEEAACRDMPISYFFPEKSSTMRSQRFTHQEERAKAICLRCPVRRECLTYAVTPHEYQSSAGLVQERTPYQGDGVWGGTLPAERRKHWTSDTRATVETLMALVDEQAKERGLV